MPLPPLTKANAEPNWLLVTIASMDALLVKTPPASKPICAKP